MKDRRKLIALVCGAIVLMGLLISCGRRALGPQWSLSGLAMGIQLPEMPRTPRTADAADTGDIQTDAADVGAAAMPVLPEMPTLPELPDLPELPELPAVEGAQALRFFGSLTPAVNGIQVDTEFRDEADRELEAFKAIRINVSDARLKLIPSDRYRVKYCYYTDLRQIIMENEGGVFQFRDEYNQKYIGKDGGISMSGNWSVPENYIELYYPQGASFTDVTIKDSYGDADLGALSAQTLTLTLGSGDCGMTDVRAEKMDITCTYGYLNLGNTAPFVADSVKIKLKSGDLTLTNLSSAGEMKISANYGAVIMKNVKTPALELIAHSGQVSLADVDGGEMTLEADYGDVDMVRLTTSRLSMDCSSGNVSVQGTLKGKTDIRADYGDVTLELSGAEKDHHYKLETTYGNLEVNGKWLRDSDRGDTEQYEANKGAANSITVDCSSGSVSLLFKS